MKRSIIVTALALLLGACSTMDVTLEHTVKGPSVSVLAVAPTVVPLDDLINSTNLAMAVACGADPDLLDNWAAVQKRLASLENRMDSLSALTHGHIAQPTHHRSSFVPFNYEVLPYSATLDAAVRQVTSSLGGITTVADDIKKLLETVKGWIPMNTYTAARTCTSS